jgi:hypothetical protein
MVVRGTVLDAPTLVDGYGGLPPGGPYSVSIAASQLRSLEGLRPGIDKVVNCYDASFNSLLGM